MGSRRLGVLLGLAGYLAAGCIPIIEGFPGARADTSPRDPISESRWVCLATPGTTRTDVLLRLGKPDQVVQSEAVFHYRWETAPFSLGLAVPAGSSLGVGIVAVTTRHELTVEFDDAGIVRRHAYRSHRRATWIGQ